MYQSHMNIRGKIFFSESHLNISFAFTTGSGASCLDSAPGYDILFVMLTLDKLLNFSVLYFLHLYNGHNIISVVVRIKQNEMR